MNLKALRASRKAKIEAMRALLEGAATADLTALSAEDQASYDALRAEVDSLTTSIATLEGQDELEASMNERRPAAASRQGQEPAAAGRNAPGAPASREFESFGEFMFAVRFNQNDQRLASLYNEEAGAAAAELGVSAEQRMDTGSSGGFMVPTQFRSEIMRVDPAASIGRPRANVTPAGTPPDAAISMPALDQTGTAPSNMFGGVEVKWIAEGDEKPETDAKLREIKLEPFEVAGTITVTDKLLRNWQAAGPFLEGLLSGAVYQAEDFAFIRGTGVGQPLGYLNSGAALTVPRAVANQVSYRDLVAMAAVLMMRGGSPVWIASQSVLPQIMLLKDDDGRFIYQPNARDGVGQTLLGYPLVFNNRANGLGTDGDISLVDFSMYLIKDGSGPFVASSEHVLFKQNKTVIKIFWNVDGQPWLTAPFTEENGYQVSPFVVLGAPG